MWESMDAFWNFVREMGHQLLLVGVVLLRAIVTFTVAWLISRFARKYLEPRLTRQRYGRDGALLVGRLVSIAAYVTAAVSVMSQLDVEWTGILTLLSAFTVAVGLSLQDVLKNFFSGILMLLERPFSVGDRVKVRDFEGEVQGIDIRTTLIRNRDGALLHVPNSIMFGEILANRSHFRTRRLDFTITDPKRSVEEVQAIVLRTLAPLQDVRKPVSSPRITSISPDGVTLAYSLLVQSTLTVDHEITLAIAAALDGATIGMPQ
jgi:small conductance mechanosensitive channel